MSLTKGFANVFIFPCTKCEDAVVIAQHTKLKKGLDDFQAQRLESMCPQCGNREQFLCDDARGFQSVEWNFETRSDSRTHRT